MVEGEGVASLLYWRLKDGRWPAAMPEAVRGELTGAYYNTVAQNTLLLQELFKVLDAFAMADIPVIVLKGAALVGRFYQDIGLRPMHDLDLLIPDRQVTQAMGLVQTLGYQPAEEEISPGINRQLAHNTYWRGGPDGRVGLELHWNLIASQADDRTVQVDWFWQQVEILPGVGTRYSTRQLPQLCPTAHLLYLAAHLMLRHGGGNERLIWYYDVDRVIRSGQVDWVMVQQEAQALGWSALVRYVLQGAAARFATPVPAELLESLSGEEDWQEFLAARQKMIGRSRLDTGRSRLDTRRSRLDSTWKSLEHFPWPLRLRAIFALIFPRPAYIRWRYAPRPAWTWPLYYPYRWWDVSKELLRAVFPEAGQA